jgi:hypothetical protein
MSAKLPLTPDPLEHRYIGAEMRPRLTNIPPVQDRHRRVLVSASRRHCPPAMSFRRRRSSPEGVFLAGPLLGLSDPLWSPSARTKTATGSNNGIAHGLIIDGKSFGNFVQRQPTGVESGRATPDRVPQVRRPERRARPEGKRRYRAAMDAILCGDHLNRHPRQVVSDQLATLRRAQPGLRLQRFLDHWTPGIAPLGRPRPRASAFRSSQNTGD